MVYSQKQNFIIKQAVFNCLHDFNPKYYTFGKKQYELTDWIGNVRVVINDKKTPLCTNASNMTYNPQTVSVSDFWLFWNLSAHWRMLSKSYENGYRYGFNGQEKDDEISGTGNHNTALFWEYDTRLGRRWNMDPLPTSWESFYAVNRNNPILYVDPYGDFPKVGKFIRKISPWHLAGGSKGIMPFNWKNSSLSRVSLGEWRGLANIFRRPGLGRTAPAGRMRNKGWTDWSLPEHLNAKGDPIDRTFSVNIFEIAGARGTLTGIDVIGNASNNFTRFSKTGGISQAHQRLLFASNGLQNVSKNGSLYNITDPNISNYSPGDFRAKSGSLPFLNSLPALTELLMSPFAQLFVQKKPQYLYGSIASTALWLENAFNHKPILTGKVWSLHFNAYSPFGGEVNFQYRFKYKSWEAYDAPGVKGSANSRPFWHKILYGYN